MRAIAAVSAALFLGSTGVAHADFVRFSTNEENDSIFADSDQHYTQGLRFAATWSDEPAGFWDGAFDFVFGSPPGATIERQHAFSLGQSVFTPNNIASPIPNPADRPYAGWLYGGLSLMQERKFGQGCPDAELENLDVQLGVIGPDSLAEEVQIGWHKLFAFTRPMGWQFQLHNEPGVTVTYERRARFALIGNSDFGLDVIPEAGATVGNVLTYGDVGALARLGFGLDADYGPARVRPALSGSDWSEEHLNEPLGIYAFGGFQTRLVGHNIFLDGNTWESSAHVERLPVVTDLVAGVSAFWSTHLRMDVSLVRRSKEFKGQLDPDNFATIALSSDF